MRELLMFSPDFQITNKTLQNLIEIEVANKLVQVAQLETDRETRLRQEALTKRVYSLARFSTNNLNLDDIAKIVRDEPGRDDKAEAVALRAGIIGKEKDIQQVLNLLNVSRLIEQMAYLAGKFKQGDYGEKELSQINVLLGERLVTPETVGVYRDKEVDELSTTLPPAVEIPFQIEDLFIWFKSTNKSEIHAVNKAGVMFYELLRVSPYRENNLLTAISFFLLILASEDYGFKKLWSIEEEILRNGAGFQQALASVERNGGELTVWLEYLSRCLAEAAEKTQTKVMNLMGDNPIFKSDGGRTISLSERQIVIMEEMTLKNEMTIKEIRNILPMVSDDTILRDLKNLIDKKLIRKKGKTKGALYTMGKIKSYR